MPGLIDFVLGLVLRSAVSVAGIESSPAPAINSFARRAGQPRHHTMPIYLCGPRDYTYAAPIDYLAHTGLHTHLYLFKRTFDVLGKTATVAFQKRQRLRPGAKPGSNCNCNPKIG